MNICIKLCWVLSITGCPYKCSPPPPSPLSKHGNVCNAQKRNIPHDEWITTALPTWRRGDYKGLDNTQHPSSSWASGLVMFLNIKNYFKN